MSATVPSIVISASRLHITCFQYAYKTGEIRGKTGMKKALIKSCKTL